MSSSHTLERLTKKTGESSSQCLGPKIPPKVIINELVQTELEETRASWPKSRRIIARAIDSRAWELIMGGIILVNAGLIIYETDRRADSFEPAWWQQGVDLSFFLIYCTDLVLHLYVYRMEFFESQWNKLDLFVVLSDTASLAMGQFIGNIPSFAVLRVFRLLRLAHVLELYRELHIMLTGFMSAMKAMAWASVMLIMILSLWSIIAVEVLHPINMRIAETGYYGDCERCSRAFSSVFASNLTFLQQIIAGDSWGLVSLPIIEDTPATFVIFFAVLITINLGLLNLILTVIVDVAHSAREEDELRRIAEKAREFDAAKKKLVFLCEELDINKSGELSYDELMTGMESNPRFSTTMASMDVSPDDMHIIFSMLDEDSSGTISYIEFVEQLHKLKSQDTHTMLIFIRGFLKDVRTKVQEMSELTKTEVGARTEDLVRDMKKVLYGSRWPLESALRVKIEGARGLRTDEAVGASDPYCSCEIVGKSDSRIRSHMVEDSLDPDWQFEDVIEGYALGDSLAFTVWGRDALQDEYCLGTVVLPTEELTRDKAGFEGELKLHHSGEHEAFVKVKVSSAAFSSKSTHAQNVGVMSATSAGLCNMEGKLERLMQQLADGCTEIIPPSKAAEDVGTSRKEDDIKQFAHRLEDELAKLREDMARKADEQLEVLRGFTLPMKALGLGGAQWPNGQEKFASGEEPGQGPGSQDGDVERRGLPNSPDFRRFSRM